MTESRSAGPEPSAAAQALAYEVRAALAGPATRVPLKVVDETASTNADLLAEGATAAPIECVRVALRQTAGRGRNGRAWCSDAGSLTFSLRSPLARGHAGLMGLPLAVAVAVAQAMEDLGVAEIAIKWPNDLLRRGAKLGGILVEVANGSAVIGIGLNVALAPDLAAEIGQAAADLQSPGQPALSRGLVLAAVLNRLVPALDLFGAEGFAAFRSAWTARAAWIGERVQLGSGVIGTLLGVDAQGAVRVLTDLGEERGLVGDLSLRPWTATAGKGR